MGDINTIRFTDEAKGKLMRFFTEESEPMPENTADEVVGFDHVTYEYDAGKPVVRDASFSIKRGERIAVHRQKRRG